MFENPGQPHKATMAQTMALFWGLGYMLVCIIIEDGERRKPVWKESSFLQFWRWWHGNYTLQLYIAFNVNHFKWIIAGQWWKIFTHYSWHNSNQGQLLYHFLCCCINFFFTILIQPYGYFLFDMNICDNKLYHMDLPIQFQNMEKDWKIPQNSSPFMYRSCYVLEWTWRL